MADYEERDLDDLTEEPSQHRLDELKEQGKVAVSRELSATLALLGVMLALYFLSGNFVKEFSSFMKDIFSKDLATKLDVTGYAAFTELTIRAGKLLVVTVGPVVFASLLLGV